MKQRLLASVAALATSAGLAIAQAPQGAPATDPAAVPLGQIPTTGGLVPVGNEVMYLQGGPPNPWYDVPGQPKPCCPTDRCGAFCEGCKCGDPALQVHKAAGGPDCFYFDLDSLFFYGRSMPFPAPILTVGPQFTQGIPGENGVRVLFGNRNVNFGPQAALRGTIGKWDCERCWGWEASAFITEQKAEVDNFFAPATGRQVLAVPFINVFQAPIANSLRISDPFNTFTDPDTLVTVPRPFGGSAGIYTNTRAGGAELNLLKSCCYYDRFKLNALVGFRWMTLNEQFRLDTHTEDPRDPFLTDPVVRDTTDNFTTRNQFYGGQFGIQTEWRKNRWFIDTTAKCAVGFTHEELDIHGRTRIFYPGGIGDVVDPFGIFALEPNSGKHSDKQFAFLPELNVRWGYNWTQRLSTYIGYDGIYLSRVVRPGVQINPDINPALLPASERPQFNPNGIYNPQTPQGPAEPALLFKKSDYFLQGFQFGMSFRY